MLTLVQDLRYATRALRNSPAFTAVAVVSLALGIGVNGGIFALVNAMLFRPLLVNNPERLVVLSTSDHHIEFLHGLSMRDFEDFQKDKSVFSDMVGYVPAPFAYRGEEESARLWGNVSTGNYFTTLGVRATLGRVFNEEDDRAGAPVVVLSHGCWERRFGADPGVVGRSIELNSRSLTVVGVAPREFRGTYFSFDPDLWVTFGATDAMQFGPLRSEQFWNRDFHFMSVLAYVQPGVSLAQAQTGLDLQSSRLAEAYPDTNKGVKLVVTREIESRPQPAISSLVPKVSMLLMAVVGLVLLIACANIANLALARGVSRQREVSVRLALGASRLRVVWHFFAENGMLAMLGGLVGLLVALWTADSLANFRLPVDIPTYIDMSLDCRVLLFMLAVSMLTAVVFGLLPALRASRPNLIEALREGGRGSSDGRGSLRLCNLLVIAEVTVCTLLLIFAGLFVRSLQNVHTVELGFATENRFIAAVSPATYGYDEARGKKFFRDLLESVRGLPGVRSAEFASSVPFSNYNLRLKGVEVEGRVLGLDEKTPTELFNVVGPQYFSTMGMPVVKGRVFREGDDDSRMLVAVVNEALARKFWGEEDPIGKRISVDGPHGPFREVVGVVVNSKYTLLNEPFRPVLFVPYAQYYQGEMTLHVHTAGDPAPLMSAVAQRVKTLDPRLPVTDLAKLEDHVYDSGAVLGVRALAWLVGCFGVLGLVLAMIGIYGVISYSVSQRTHELGVRLALGAQRGQLLRMVNGQGLRLGLTGILAGLLCAFGLTPLTASLLLGVAPTDTATFVGVPLTLIMVVVLGSYTPARRAARIDPMTALRHE